jgi:cytochrome c biogenesis protein CcmG, thiol:disulfide interchange protein DsbE
MFTRVSGFRRVIFAALVLVSVFATAQGGEREPAPRFNAKTMSGEKFNNDSLKGRVVLLEFWATWCPYCRQEEAMIDEVEHDYAKQGLMVLAIDVNESKKQVKKYLVEHPRKTRIVLTEDTNLAAMFAAKSYPIYVVIDKDGNVAGTQRGAAGRGALERLLERAGLEGAGE